ncbi:MAG: hypothetical protein RJA09_1196 [Pseudomonadota bacterium]
MSKPDIKQVDVQIMGQSYLLACPLDGEPALLEAVAKVDTAMCRIRDAGKVKARDRIAVLASLNIAFELSQKDATALRSAAFANSEAAALPEAAAPAATDAALKNLLDRLDRALVQDGQLL